MWKFIILATLVASCASAPSVESKANGYKNDDMLLSRPSPINPEVTSDPKPDEHIIKITDPKEIAKYKRDAEDDPYDHIAHLVPTVQPATKVAGEHLQRSNKEYSTEAAHRQKREQTEQTANANNSRRKLVDPSAMQRTSTLKKEIPKVSYHNTTPSSPKGASGSVTATAIRDLPNIRQRRQANFHPMDVPTVTTPLIYRDTDKKPHVTDVQHQAPFQVPHESATAFNIAPIQQQPQQSQQLLRANAATPPVPPPSTVTNQALKEQLKPQLPQLERHVTPHTLPVHIPVTSVAPAVRSSTLPALNHALPADTHQVTAMKRDIPVPLVPKYHHPEESPKSDEDTDEEKLEKANKSDGKNKEASTEKSQQHEQHYEEKHYKNGEDDDDSKSDEIKISHESSQSKMPMMPSPPHLPIHDAVHPELVQQYQHQSQPQHPHIGEQSKGKEEHREPIEHSEDHKQFSGERNNKAENIASDIPANKDHLVLKHPVPVVELFSRPKQ